MNDRISLTYDLMDLELIALVFKNQLHEPDVISLSKEHDLIVLTLRNVFYIDKKKGYETPQDIIDLMISKYSLPQEFAISKYRGRKKFVVPRHKAMTICKHIFKKLTLVEIGSYFGGKDHASVLHSVKTVKNWYDTDKKFRQDFDDMQMYFLGSIEIFN
jgi:chromosomal replication initiator protein